MDDRGWIPTPVVKSDDAILEEIRLRLQSGYRYRNPVDDVVTLLAIVDRVRARVD
jgi:hypothetical protein